MIIIYGVILSDLLKGILANPKAWEQIVSTFSGHSSAVSVPNSTGVPGASSAGSSGVSNVGSSSLSLPGPSTRGVPIDGAGSTSKRSKLSSSGTSKPIGNVVVPVKSPAVLDSKKTNKTPNVVDEFPSPGEGEAIDHVSESEGLSSPDVVLPNGSGKKKIECNGTFFF